MHAIIRNAAFASLPEVREQFDPQKLTGANVGQSDLDQAVASGNMTRISAAATAIRRTDWRGLTPEQERREEDERAAHSRREEVLAEEEYEQTMAEVREKADRLMERLEEQRRECLKKLADADARAIVLPDGRRVLVGNRPGEFVYEDTGKALEGNDKAKAQSLQEPDSETAAERKALRDRLISIGNAEEHVRKAQALAGQDGKDLTTDEKKQNEVEAQKELAEAQAMADNLDVRKNHIEASTDTTSALGATDTLSTLGLGASANGRTTSFAATLDRKDSRVTGLQDHFTGVAQKPDVPPDPVPTGKPAPTGTIVRTQVPHSNQ